MLAAPTVIASRAIACGVIASKAAMSYVPHMSILPILIHPDPRLKKVAEPIEAVTDKLRKLADDMLETMYDAPGIGPDTCDARILALRASLPQYVAGKWTIENIAN